MVNYVLRIRGSVGSEEAFDGPAELPLVTFDPTIPSIDGTTFPVASGGNLQTAINSAAAANGDLNHLISLDAGGTYTGNYTLPAKSGTNPTGPGYIIIRSAGSLPAVGTRVLPANAAQLAKITESIAVRIFETDAAAHHYWLIGLEITNTATLNNDMLRLGDKDNPTPANDAHHINVSRCYIHQKNDATEVTRAIALNTNYSAITDNYISGVIRDGSDTQCVWGCNGIGAYLIRNNYLQAAGENIMFGGADPAITNRIPADIAVLKNYFTKNLAWIGSVTVKNLFELKIGQRILVEGNVLENCYQDAQAGHCFRLKSENQDDTAAWSETSDVTLRYNIIRNCSNPFSFSDQATEAATAVPMNNLSVHDNLAYDFGETGADASLAFYMGGLLANVSVKNNTAVNSQVTDWALNMSPTDHVGAPSVATGIVFQNNIVPLGTYGVKASGAASGTPSLNAFAPGQYTYAGNVEIGSRGGATYPAGNTTVAAISNVGFTNAGADDYSLAGGSVALTAGVGGARSGADIAAVLAATSGVV